MAKKISVSELSSSQLKDNLRIFAKDKSDFSATSDSAIREILLDNAPHIFKKKDGGMMNKRLKPVDKNKNPGLAKLPKGVRNKMGFMKDGGLAAATKKLRAQGMKDGGSAKKFPDLSGDGKVTMKDVLMGRGVIKKKDGGMVLEIGLRPATKKEMKMAKEMKPKKMANGGMARGTGAAITGKGFKGVF